MKGIYLRGMKDIETSFITHITYVFTVTLIVLLVLFLSELDIISSISLTSLYFLLGYCLLLTILALTDINFKRFRLLLAIESNKQVPKMLECYSISKLDLSRYLRDTLEYRHVLLDTLLEDAKLPLSYVIHITQAYNLSYTSCFLYELDNMQELLKFIDYTKSFEDSERVPICVYYVENKNNKVEVISVEVLSFE